ncbi:hypothetical protein EYZ11_005899 [Aspergillus tanneri]|uniref:Uncharacterized protein n=1 Tax=Aspergillus tanneri TaxID=1220188 RepID=A0A4S3JMQ1_9EURO|nr:hypothetical protein EYZ11_005899 [Aspergillus tanneri]
MYCPDWTEKYATSRMTLSAKKGLHMHSVAFYIRFFTEIRELITDLVLEKFQAQRYELKASFYELWDILVTITANTDTREIIYGLYTLN